MREYNLFENHNISFTAITKYLKSPLEFLNYMYDLKPKEKTQSLDLGTLVHVKVLEPEKLNDYVFTSFDKPSSAQEKVFADAISKIKDLNEDLIVKIGNEIYSSLSKIKILEKYKKYKKYIDFTKYNNKIELPKKLDYISDICVKKLKKHKKANELLFQNKNNIYKNEEILMFKYKNLPCKIIPDKFIINEEIKKIILIDLKTTSDMSNYRKSFFKYKYGLQIALYKLCISILYPNYEIECIHIVVETGNNYEVKCLHISETLMFEYEEKLIKILDDIHEQWVNYDFNYTLEYHKGNGLEIFE